VSARGAKVLIWVGEGAVNGRYQELPYPVSIGVTLASFIRADGGFEVDEAVGDQAYFSRERLREYAALVIWMHGEPVSREAERQLVDAVECDGLGFVGLHSVCIPIIRPELCARLLGCTAAFDWEVDVPMELRPAAEATLLRDVEPFACTDEAYYEPLRLAEDVTPQLEMIVTEPACRKVYHFTGEGAGYGGPLLERNVEGLRTRVCWTRAVGKGRIFYFQGGHETHPIYTYPTVQEIILTGLRWVSRREA